MRRLLLASCLLFFAFPVFSQSTGSINGTVRDTADNKVLHQASVVLLRAQDSVLVKFTRSNTQGQFRIDSLAPGDYVVQITYPKFVDWTDKISLASGQSLDLGNVAFTLRSQLLQEIVIRSGSAMKIKGDTTEFTADSFRVRPGATVEELLKVLPGLQVNSKGEITAQGKKVDKVLVDGEEFFGDDPTIATQNIGAKAVDKVQVFESKSDQDQLKSIGATGEGSKTINIKLKESAKKGYFGRVEGSTDFDKLVNGKVMYNRFTGNQKFSVYGTKSQINTGALGWEDRNKLGIENDYEYDEISGYYYSFGSTDEFSNWSLRGLPNSYTAGGLYGNKWREDKHKLNFSYLYNRLGTNNTTRTVSQTTIGDVSNYNNSVARTEGLAQQHSVNGKYEWKIDSLASIKYVIAGSFKKNDNYGNTYSEALNDNLDTLNTNNRNNEQHTEKRQLDNVLTYKQLFKKKNRQLVTTARLTLIDDQQTALLQSVSRFVRRNGPPNVLDSLELIDQQKRNNGNATNYGVKFTYNEPLTELWNLIAEYSFNQSKSSSHRNSFDKDVDGKYTDLNPTFSNNADLDATSNAGTLFARYTGKKLRMAFGSGLSAIRLRLDNLDIDTRTTYNFTGFTPQAQFRYQLKQQEGISLSYKGNTVQPTLNQLQPLRNNDDPLRIYVGNPDLKVAFNHNINLNYNNYKVLTQQYTWVGVGINFLRNTVSTTSVVDLETGKTTYMPVNVNGNYNWYLYGDWNSGGGDKKLIHELSPNASGGRTANFLNNARNENTYYTFSLRYGLRYSLDQKYNFAMYPKVERSISKSSLSPDVNNNYWVYSGDVEGWVMLPAKFELSTEVEANIRQSTNRFASNRQIVWNAELSRRFFKEKTLKLSFIAHDILNQNIGFQRTINSNFFSEQRYDLLGRYFLVQASWTFNKMPGK
ncbi:MAG: TonB-dependent receptor [Terrimonas ferruginea]|uniref:TonB-dependent receptor n=1 Tax=Terrimonas ferruginea TaxID=249 RepID=UPI0009271AEF|nr:TonB-dependent receptor [Terrimonas ferruginea]MBN8782942.1 TonB-dependent receptor [Terrimonas ferruginea]OJW44132.1 MAG: hypothetical protein BGO56_19770 [Sphingobacteriales bacterium 48-107]